MTPAEVHAEGLEQVARIEQRMAADVMAPLGCGKDTTFAAFVAGVQADSAHCFGTVAELLEGYH